MFILVKKGLEDSPRIQAMLDPGDDPKTSIWNPEHIRRDDWAAVQKRYPGEPWVHMSHLYGRHRGETCVIAGSGPSLSAALPVLQHTRHPVLAINRAVHALPHARFFMCHDDDAYRRSNPHVGPHTDRVVSIQLYDEVRQQPCFMIEATGTPSQFRVEDRPLFWNQITFGWTLHLAIRMGFQRIVTIGVDLSIAQSYDNFKYENMPDPEWLHRQHLGVQLRTLEMFEPEHKKEWYERDVEILDASGGPLPVPKVQLKDVL